MRSEARREHHEQQTDHAIGSKGEGVAARELTQNSGHHAHRRSAEFKAEEDGDPKIVVSRPATA
jgi:hypothetical protein